MTVPVTQQVAVAVAAVAALLLAGCNRMDCDGQSTASDVSAYLYEQTGARVKAYRDAQSDPRQPPAKRKPNYDQLLAHLDTLAVGEGARARVPQFPLLANDNLVLRETLMIRLSDIRSVPPRTERPRDTRCTGTISIGSRIHPDRVYVYAVEFEGSFHATRHRGWKSLQIRMDAATEERLVDAIVSQLNLAWDAQAATFRRPPR